MARTGRFGRQFREATDLTASIVALYERYERQRDEVIFDAWTNGGEFEGRPVTDQRLMNHMKGRRDALDKSDPLWAEWDNRIGQYEFAIADQDNSIAHARALAAASHIRNPRARAAAMNAANAARGAFFRQQAQQHPRNSAAYRDLMLKAAQFARVQQVARASADKMTAHERFLKSYYGIYEEKIKPAELVIDAIEVYAVQQGMLSANEAGVRGGLWQLDTMEWGNLHDLLSGLQQSDAWPRIERMISRFVPGWDGNLDPDDYHRIARRANQGIDEQIALAKKQKGDYRGYIDNAKNQKPFINRVSGLDRRMSVFDRYVTAWQQHEADRKAADGDPFDEAQADTAYVEDLRKLKKQVMRGGGPQELEALELWASLDAEEKMTLGDVEGLQGTSAVPLYMAAEGYSGGTSVPQGGSAVEEQARQNKEHRDLISGLVAKTHVYIPPPQGAAAISQQQLEPYEGRLPDYGIAELVSDPITGKPQMAPNEVIMPLSFTGGGYLGTDGKLVKLGQGVVGARVTMSPVFMWTQDAEGQWQEELMGQVAFYQGAPLFKWASRKVDDANPFYTYGSIDTVLDTSLSGYVSQGGQNGYIMGSAQRPQVGQQELLAQLATLQTRTPEAAIEAFDPIETPAAPGAPTTSFEEGGDALSQAQRTGRWMPEDIIGGALGNIVEVGAATFRQAGYEAGQMLGGFFGENEEEAAARRAQETQALIDTANARGYTWDPAWMGEWQGAKTGLAFMQDGALSYGDPMSAFVTYNQTTRKTYSSIAPEDLVSIGQMNGWDDETLQGVANTLDLVDQLQDENHEAMVLQKHSDSGWRLDPAATFDYAELQSADRGLSAWGRFTEEYRPTSAPTAEGLADSPFVNVAELARVPGAQELDFATTAVTTPTTTTPGLGSMANPVNEVGDLPGPPAAPDTGVTAPKQMKVPRVPDALVGMVRGPQSISIPGAGTLTTPQMPPAAGGIPGATTPEVKQPTVEERNAIFGY